MKDHPILKANDESIEPALMRGNRFLTAELEAELPPHILVTTNSPGYDACDAVLKRAEKLGVFVRMDDGSPLAVAKLDDLEAVTPPAVLPFEPYDDEDAAIELNQLGFNLVLLPDFFFGSAEDDGSRCEDGSIPARWYVVERFAS